jgi:hypothetical protein
MNGRGGGGGVSPSSRRLASTALAIAGSALALLGGIALYTREEVFDSDGFADNAAEALKDRDISEALADPITDQAIDKGPDVLINVRPLLLTAPRGCWRAPPSARCSERGRASCTRRGGERLRLPAAAGEAVRAASGGAAETSSRSTTTTAETWSTFPRS